MHPIDALIKVAAAAQAMRQYLSTQVGPTDDYDCEINFSSEKEAAKFYKLCKFLDKTLDDLEETALS